MGFIMPFLLSNNNRLFIIIPPSFHDDWGDHPDLAHGCDVGHSHRNCSVLAVVCGIPKACRYFNYDSNQWKHECDRLNHECSHVGSTGGHTNGGGKCTDSWPNASGVSMACFNCATVLLWSYCWSRAAYGARDREQKTMIWFSFFFHDHEKLWWYAVIGNIGKNDQHCVT